MKQLLNDLLREIKYIEIEVDDYYFYCDACGIEKEEAKDTIRYGAKEMKNKIINLISEKIKDIEREERILNNKNKGHLNLDFTFRTIR
jgi:hypothetical protein